MEILCLHKQDKVFPAYAGVNLITPRNKAE